MFLITSAAGTLSRVRSRAWAKTISTGENPSHYNFKLSARSQDSDARLLAVDKLKRNGNCMHR